MGADTRDVKVDRKASSNAIWSGVSLGEAKSSSTLSGRWVSSITRDTPSAAGAGAAIRSAASSAKAPSSERFITLPLPSFRSGRCGSTEALRSRSPYGTRPRGAGAALLRAAQADWEPGRDLAGDGVLLDGELAERQARQRESQELALDGPRDASGELRPPADAHVTADARAVLNQGHRDGDERPSRGRAARPYTGHVGRRHALRPLGAAASARQRHAQRHRPDDRSPHLPCPSFSFSMTSSRLKLASFCRCG